ncbi:MAG: TonB-dependent receptor plug domain-containing protein [Microscillaceae bacterium]|nr:TonB-dependent receptor plug domain-containing protein [Microscillaceae bacterium]
MNHFLRLIFCLGLSLSVLQAQDNATITGTVIDQGQAPVIGANVVLQGTNYGTTTNAAGRFTLANVPAGSYELRVSFIGFQAFSQNIQLNAGQSLDVAVSLTEEPLTLEGLIVTAQRREQIIQEVPVAVTSWEGDFLKTRGVFELDALSDYVPGLQVQIQSVNNPGFVIRGITSDNGDSRIEPRVSVFQDGVSISKSRGSVVEIFDMERVEVLKGPQGTLFGRGAQIGAVHLIQNKAKNELSGELTLGAGNEGQYLANGYINFPIAEGKLFGRVAAIYNKRDGVIENLSGGDLNGK